MVAEMDSMRKLRVFAFFVTNGLTRMYNQGIHINEEEFLRVKKWALYAQEKNVSLIFLPSHKSHIDYLVISYVFFRLGIALPHIAGFAPNL
jgi:glycerol-3-phosphate O-acyltransferase